MTLDEFKDKINSDVEFYDEILRFVDFGGRNIILKNETLRNVHLESWYVDPCLYLFLKEIGREVPEDADEDFWWETLQDAIDYYYKKDGWRGYIYIDPEICGAPLGQTLWFY